LDDGLSRRRQFELNASAKLLHPPVESVFRSRTLARIPTSIGARDFTAFIARREQVARRQGRDESLDGKSLYPLLLLKDEQNGKEVIEDGYHWL